MPEKCSAPIDTVRWVPVEQVRANDYNPNQVAERELNLLYKSILHDGYTQPIVTIWDPEVEKYIIVDGFHRWLVGRKFEDIRERYDGQVPIVTIKKEINERMASTVRHNRARGKHSVAGMSSLVFRMLKNGASDEEICHELGMEPDELIRLKHLTGFEKYFRELEYRNAWESTRQLKIRKEAQQNAADTE